MEHLQEPVNIKQEYIYWDAANSQTNFPFMKEVIKQEMDCKAEPDIERNPQIETGMLEHEQLNQTNYCRFSSEDNISQIVNNGDTDMFGENRDTQPDVQITTVVESIKKKDDLKSRKIKHTGEKPYKCVCGAGFARSCELKSHTQTHRGEKPFQCDICGAGFTQSQGLTGHKRTHTGEKPFKCDICSVCFTQPNNLKRHKRTHTGEKPHTCDICGVCFTQSANLKQHKTTHTGKKLYKCDVCNAGFKRSSMLKLHMRRHPGEKLYKCDCCGDYFLSCDLKLRKITHTGDKSYFCGACFTWSDELKVQNMTYLPV